VSAMLQTGRSCFSTLHYTLSPCFHGHGSSILTSHLNHLTNMSHVECLCHLNRIEPHHSHSCLYNLGTLPIHANEESHCCWHAKVQSLWFYRPDSATSQSAGRSSFRLS
jgi:hypothetical protein